EARVSLEKRGIPFQEGSIFTYAANGDVETVRELLEAGVSVNAADADGRSALAVAAANGRTAVVQLLVERGAKVFDLLPVAPKKEKDRWDKLGALAPLTTLFSSLVIGAIGGWFTSTYNKAQLDQKATSEAREQRLKEEANKLQELQAVEKFIPHLAGDEK